MRRAAAALYREPEGATGEIALRLGADHEPFGVINVGDDSKLISLCEEHGLATANSNSPVRYFTASTLRTLRSTS